ncbi:hypothetical protein U1Q18_005860, partial [Sarracenia purpurea var. burkii]
MEVDVGSGKESLIATTVAAKDNWHNSPHLHKKGKSNCGVSEKVAGEVKSGSKMKKKLAREKK